MISSLTIHIRKHVNVKVKQWFPLTIKTKHFLFTQLIWELLSINYIMNDQTIESNLINQIIRFFVFVKHLHDYVIELFYW